jgi:hypothetical protein
LKNINENKYTIHILLLLSYCLIFKMNTTINTPRIKRTPNSFMIWSSEERKNWKNITNQSFITKTISDKWNSLPTKIKLQYKIKADILSKEQKHKYPHYKYIPKFKKLKQLPEPITKSIITPTENSNIFLQKQNTNMQSNMQSTIQSLNTINYFDNFEPDYYTEIQLFYETIPETITEPIPEPI